MRNRLFGFLLVAAAGLVVSSAAMAQYAPPAAPAGQKAAAANKPYDPKDLSGAPWSPTDSGNNLTKDEPPMKPQALAVYKNWKTEYTVPPVGNDQNDDPLYRCEPGSVPRFYFNGHPVQFVQTPKEIIQLIETYRNFRIFYMDGRKQPDHPEGTWYGDSVGHWDGNTLVVESVNFNDHSWLDKPGHIHSDQLALTERINRTAYDHMKIDINIHDPVNYTADWGGSKNFVYRPDWQIEDYLCSPHDEGYLFKDVRNKATDHK